MTQDTRISSSTTGPLRTSGDEADPSASTQPHSYIGSTVDKVERIREEEGRGEKCPSVLRSSSRFEYLQWYEFTGIRLEGGVSVRTPRRQREAAPTDVDPRSGAGG